MMRGMRWLALCAVLGTGCTLYFDDASPAPAPQPDPQPPPDPGPPAPAVVTSIAGTPFALAVDDTAVYWSEAEPELGRAALVRWHKATAARTNLVTLVDGHMPAELAVAGDFVYYAELNAYPDQGRDLGQDRLMRVRTDGSAPPELVADHQWFEDYAITQIVAAGDWVYWASWNGFTAPAGVLARQRVATGAIETVAANLDQPHALAVDAAWACFHTGSTSARAPIACVPADPASAAAPHRVGFGFVRALAFAGASLAWANEDRQEIVATDPSVVDDGTADPARRFTTGAATYVLGLTSDRGELLWNEAVDGYTSSASTIVRGGVAVAHRAASVTAFAADATDVYLIDRDRGQLLRAARR